MKEMTVMPSTCALLILGWLLTSCSSGRDGASETPDPSEQGGAGRLDASPGPDRDAGQARDAEGGDGCVGETCDGGVAESGPEPELDAAPDGAGGGAGAYEPCNDPEDCEQAYQCIKLVTEPQYGQCTRTCAQDTDCPASPAGNPVACHPTEHVCLSLCGVHGGTCPDWLACTAHEMCLEPSNVVASKGPGEHCTGSDECLDDAECVEGQYTAAYCAPLCTTNDDCSVASPGSVGQCANAGAFSFCMFFCGIMANGAPCPGDMVCEGNAVCR